MGEHDPSTAGGGVLLGREHEVALDYLDAAGGARRGGARRALPRVRARRRPSSWSNASSPTACAPPPSSWSSWSRGNASSGASCSPPAASSGSSATECAPTSRASCSPPRERRAGRARRGERVEGVERHLVRAAEQDAVGRVELVERVERHLVLAAPGASSWSSASRGSASSWSSVTSCSPTSRASCAPLSRTPSPSRGASCSCSPPSRTPPAASSWSSATSCAPPPSSGSSASRGRARRAPPRARRGSSSRSSAHRLAARARCVERVDGSASSCRAWPSCSRPSRTPPAASSWSSCSPRRGGRAPPRARRRPRPRARGPGSVELVDHLDALRVRHRHHLDGRVLPLAAPPLGREVQHNGAAARLPGEEPADRLVRDARPLDIAGREEPRHVPGEVCGERGAGARGGSAGSDVSGGRNGNRGPGNVSDGRRTPGRLPSGSGFCDSSGSARPCQSLRDCRRRSRPASPEGTLLV